MFPTVLDMNRYDQLTRSSGSRFHMYYAPHLSNGIGLATAAHPLGPWIPFRNNPVLVRDRVPGAFDHISSPEIVYRRELGELWMYFHGLSNPRSGAQNTYLATSRDGVEWSPRIDGPVLFGDRDQTGEGATTAYLRVFRRTHDPYFYGLYKCNKTHGLARSTDGIQWEHSPHNPILSPSREDGEFDLIRHTAVIVRDDVLWILYSTRTRSDLTREEIKLASVSLGVGDSDWTTWGPLRRHGTLFSPELGWEAGDVRDPFVLTHLGSHYLYYVGGHELGIGVAASRSRASAKFPCEVSRSAPDHLPISQAATPKVTE